MLKVFMFNHQVNYNIYLKYCLNIAQTYEKRNLLLQKDGKLTLTKEGIFVSDGIMSDLLWV